VNHEATTVARLLADEWCARWGIPIQLLSDQGREFESNLMKELTLALGIDKIRSSLYRPQGNAVVERLHRTMHSMIAKVISEHQRDWNIYVPSVMAAYRATRHDSTGYSPNYLILGQEVMAPLDLVCDAPPEGRRVWFSPDEFVEQRQHIAREAFAAARETLGKAAERAKHQYDLRVRPKIFTVGSWVWYHSPRRYVGRNVKWQRQYSGPFLVTQELGPVNVTIQKSPRAVAFVVHIDKLKLCQSDTPDSWLKFGPDHQTNADPQNVGNASLQSVVSDMPTIESVASELLAMDDNLIVHRNDLVGADESQDVLSTSELSDDSDESTVDAPALPQMDSVMDDSLDPVQPGTAFDVPPPLSRPKRIVGKPRRYPDV